MPITIDGTPPSSSVMNRIGRASRLVRYSLRKTAARMPIGTASTDARPTTIRLPSMACPSPPPAAPAGRGAG